MLNQTRIKKSEEDIIGYLDRENEREEKRLFSYLTGSTKYDEDIEAELRSMLELHGFRLCKRIKLGTAERMYRDEPFFSNTYSTYYSISQHKRSGCHPCGIPKDDPWMKKCNHWKNCHYGMAGTCELSQIKIN